MAQEITSNGVSIILASSDSNSTATLQIVDLKAVDSANTRYKTMLNDGNAKIAAMLPSSAAADVQAGRVQNLGVIKLLAYSTSTVGNQKVLIITKFEVVSPALESVVSTANSMELDLKPVIADLKPASAATLDAKPDFSKIGPNGKPVKSASQIMLEQVGSVAPAPRIGHSRRVHPLMSLNPYEGNWTIKVRVTSKGPMRTFSNSRGGGNVFNVELTDEEGTQIQATMFKEAADKFYPKLHLGKMFYISKGSLRAANKRYATVSNDYEMTLNQNTEVEEIVEEEGKPFAIIPLNHYKLVKIDNLGPYVNGRALVDVVGIVKDVQGVVSIRRKSDNTEIPKRDITIADQSQKTVVVSLWNDFAKVQGAELADMVNDAPTVTLKGLRVSDYQGVSLSTTNRSIMEVNSDLPEAQSLRQWYDNDGKSATLVSAGANLPGNLGGSPGSRNSSAERAMLSEITEPSVGEDKTAYFNVRACISYIRPDQAMWYLGCITCNRKVQENGSQYWCEGCQKLFDTCNRRYIMLAKMSDASGETWVSAFNEQAEYILGRSADSLNEIKSVDDQKEYQSTLKEASWVPKVFRVSVAQVEYMNEKRQRITIRTVAPVDWSVESKLLLQKIASVRIVS